MSYEIEIKAHVKKDNVSNIDLLFAKSKLGSIEKYDIYWSRNGEYPYEFRTRLETEDGISQILMTRKPIQQKGVTEVNEELEFSAPEEDWDTILLFFESLGYRKGRIKQKKGFHYNVERNDFPVHVELLDVTHLGWFLEMEICSDEELSSEELTEAQKTLTGLVVEAGLSTEDIEPLGYNRMLRLLEK